jgi:hypothetical protein
MDVHVRMTGNMLLDSGSNQFVQVWAATALAAWSAQWACLTFNGFAPT